MKCEPRRSPEASPATIPMVSGASAIPAPLPDDAAGCCRQEIEHRLDFRALADLARQLIFGLLQGKSRLVESLVRPLQLSDNVRSKVAPLQSFCIDPEWTSGIARHHHVGRDVLQDD